jgi:hypothetical protein
MSNETYICTGIQMLRPPQSHLIMVASDSDSEDEYGSNKMIGSEWYYNQEMESDVEDVFAVRDIGWETFVADRPEKKISMRQKHTIQWKFPVPHQPPIFTIPHTTWGHPALAGILLYPFHTGWPDSEIFPCHTGWPARIRIVNIKDYTYWKLNPHTDDHNWTEHVYH